MSILSFNKLLILNEAQTDDLAGRCHNTTRNNYLKIRLIKNYFKKTLHKSGTKGNQNMVFFVFDDIENSYYK